MMDRPTEETPATPPGVSDDTGERIVYVMPENAIYGLAEDELSLLDLWRIVWASRYFIIAVTTAFAVASIAYALTATKWYQAEVLLAPAEENSTQALSGTLGGLASLAGVNVGGGDDAVALAVLKSRNFTEAFIKDENLLPLFFPEDRGAQNGAENDVGPDIRDGIRYFRDNVRTLTEDPDTGLITLTIEWKDPKLSADWANLIVKRLNDRMRQEALEEAERNIAYLRAELEETNVVTLQQSIGRLMETELQKLMLARGNEEFAFRILDAADVPNQRSKPQRTLIVVMATFLGGALAVLCVLIRHAVRNSERNGRS